MSKVAKGKKKIQNEFNEEEDDDEFQSVSKSKPKSKKAKQTKKETKKATKKQVISSNIDFQKEKVIFTEIEDKLYERYNNIKCKELELFINESDQYLFNQPSQITKEYLFELKESIKHQNIQ